MNKLLASLFSIILLMFSNIALADWFLSSETKALIVKAEAGDTDAQLRVGAAYDFGKGAPRDGNEAMKWYRMAADRGNAEAQNSLGSSLQAEKRYLGTRKHLHKGTRLLPTTSPIFTISAWE